MKKIIVSLAVVALSGCATWSTSSVDAQTADVKTAAVQPTSSANVTITDGDIVDKTYVSLGDVTVNVNKTTVFHPNPTPALVNEKLKEKAAELGADAVIFVRYGSGGISMMSWGSLEGKGRAVRYVK